MQLITLFALSFLLCSTSAALAQDEGNSKYIVETREIVIEGQSAIDLYTAMKGQPRYSGNKIATKKRRNVTCLADISSARNEGEFVSNATCLIKLSTLRYGKIFNKC